MNKTRRSTALALALCAVLLLSACKKKKPNVPPPQAQAPTITQPAPPPPPDVVPIPSENPAPSTDAATKTPESKTPPKHSHPRTARKPGNGNEKPASSADKPSDTAKNTQPAKVVVAEGGAPTPPSEQIVTAVGTDDAAHDQATTEQLLESTETNLKNIKRQLSSDEQSIVVKIRDFVSQSRQASKEGDAGRAHTLAKKAHLLSDELAKGK